MNLQLNNSFAITDITPADKVAYLEHLQEKQIYDQTLNIPHPYTEADADWWVNHVAEETQKQGRSVNWAIRRQDGFLIGGIGYHDLEVGNTIAVTGTTSLDENGEVHAPGDAYLQTKRCLEIIERAIKPLGADRRNILRTRMFVTDIKRWEEFGRAHGEFFEGCPPATTMVEVNALIDPEMLIEIEADAIIQ